jgi:hypothetical protein
MHQFRPDNEPQTAQRTRRVERILRALRIVGG